ncbi:amino acid adenylation domain-containing protein, partial [Rhodococcus sp. 105337]|uniref:amino acid adenylation domain-containing protein n=1 Tax=Rhodococcus sp. 105337 TaxID=2725310 RepID=UPI003211F26E
MERNPSAPAVMFEDRSWTYAEIDAESSRLARALIDRGLGPEDIVAVSLARSFESVLAIWAVAKTGAAFVPVDPNYPPDRVAYMLADSGAAIGLTLAATVSSLPDTVEWLALDDPQSRAEVEALSPAPVSFDERVSVLRPENPAYVIYTSGSTGRPKGVPVTHSGLSDLVQEMVDRFGATASSRTLHVASPSFDASVLEWLMAISVSAAMVVAPPDAFAGAELTELLRRHRVTHALITPAVLASLDSEGLDGLEMVVSGGEACPPDVVERWAPGRRFLNAYGPTEATIMTHCSGALEPGRPVTIGTPVRNLGAYVLDSRLNPVAPGVAGELYVSGPALARGYRGRPGLTAERFVAGPDGTRLYRTGDLVRAPRSGDDELIYLGRNDFQIKIRGLRVELGEIDAALATSDGVDFAITVGRETPAGEMRLVSYVHSAGGVEIDAGEISATVSEMLPAHMVPSAIVVLDDVPLTPSGKIDRAALPEPESVSVQFRPPATALEVAVAEEFGALLGVECIGLDDDLFALGGNSLVATRLAARLGERLGTRVPARLLFEHSTVGELAALIEPLAVGNETPLVAQTRPELVPLSLAQQRMWFLNRLNPGSAANNIPVAIRLSGSLDVDALQAAVSDVVARHESLRTVYPEVDGVGFQKVLGAGDAVVEVRVEDVSADDAPGRVVEAVTTGFDVTLQVPVRVRLLRVAPQEHLLVVVIHHISGDGFSMGPLTRDVVTAYAARAAGAAPGWSALEVQYADYSLWQREVLGDESDPESLAAKQIAFWKQSLDGLPDQLDLPTDRPRPAEQSFAGDDVEFDIDADLHRKLVELARARNSTLFMAVHAAFAVLLARLSGTEDITVGTPIAGRGRRELDDLIGMFVNTLVLRSHVDVSGSFDALLEQTRERDLQAFAHADVPFERLVEVLNPERSTARHPLFQVGLSFQNLAATSLELPGLTVSGLDAQVQTSQFDLHLVAADRYHEDGSPAGIGSVLTFATDLFDRSTVVGIAERFVRVLEQIVAEPGLPVGDLDILGVEERNLVLEEHNRTSCPLGAPVTLVDLFDTQVRRDPAATAIVFEGVSLSYQEFDARVNRLARHLISVGVGPESTVALAMRRSVELLVGMYAVAKAGGAYVPLDPDQPAERTHYIVSVAAPAVVLTTARDEFDVPEDMKSGIVVRLDTAHLDEYSASPVTDLDRLAPLRAENTAYVIFTSGSTGRPKGVAVSHAAIVNQMLWMRDEYDLGPDDALLLKTAATFDLSVWEFWSALVSGGRVVVAGPDGHRDPAYLNDLVASEGVTTLHVVPSMLSALMTDRDGVLPSSLRRVLAIGEALPASTAQRFLAGNEARLDNLYGPTEAAVSVTDHTVDVSDVVSVPIGSPQWNTRLYVLDARLQPVPVGVPGELYLAGAQLARGYFARPDLTAERFVASPWGDGERLYRTGDLVAWTSDGELEYLGRTDFQVKVRGFRIELGEIESALRRMDGIRDVAVVARGSERVGTRVVAYLVPGPDVVLDTGEVAFELGRSVPAYMVPSAFVVLEGLPLNANGKLDRRALPDPVFEVTEFRAPATSAEQVVASVFSEVLGVERVGLDDDFFALGGNSLIATQVVARLGAALDTRVPVRVLFEASTVGELAVRVEQVSGGGAGVPLVAGVRPAQIPLSLAQQRMWFLNRLDPESAVNNIPVAIRLSGSLDVDALQAAVSDVVARHESLRTVYPEIDGVGFQEVLPASDSIVEVRPETVAADEVPARVTEVVAAGFDVTQQVPIRVRLLRITPEEHVLVVVVHHISGDGFSMAPLTRDVVAAYVTRVEGKEPAWAELEVQYADYTLWQREVLGDESDPESLLARETEFWRTALADLPEESTLPSDRPRPAVSSYRGASHGFTIDRRVRSDLTDLARRSGATEFMVVHAALAVLLSRLSAQSDIAIGTPVAGRGEAALDDLVGMFVNTLVLRTSVDGGVSFGDFLDEVRRVDLDAFAHADVPFERLVEV